MALLFLISHNNLRSRNYLPHFVEVETEPQSLEADCLVIPGEKALVAAKIKVYFTSRLVCLFLMNNCIKYLKAMTTVFAVFPPFFMLFLAEYFLCKYRDCSEL